MKVLNMKARNMKVVQMLILHFIKQKNLHKLKLNLVKDYLKNQLIQKVLKNRFFKEDEDCDDDVAVAKRSPSPRRFDGNGCVDSNADENDQQVPSNEVNDGNKKKMLKQADRQNRDKSNHLLLSPYNCKNRCIMKVEEQWHIIHGRFWELSIMKEYYFYH